MRQLGLFTFAARHRVLGFWVLARPRRGRAIPFSSVLSYVCIVVCKISFF